MDFQKPIKNIRRLKTHFHRAWIRPDPFSLPGWLLEPHLTASALKAQFREELIRLIDIAQTEEQETGTFICYDYDKELLHLGEFCRGTKQMIIIRDCIGYRPVGSYHVHLAMRKPIFSPPDIQFGLRQFVLAVGGLHLFDSAAYSMAIVCPYKYWTMPNREKDKVDYDLSEATRIILLMNKLYCEQPPGWKEAYKYYDKQQQILMDETFELMEMVYVTL